MLKLIIGVYLAFFASNVFATTFEKITIAGHEKNIITEKQIRFENSKNEKSVIHLQVSSISEEHKWVKATLDEDIKKMFQNRLEMYNILGFSNVEFSSYKLSDFEKLPILFILGSYKKINNKKVIFAEGNLYFKDSFLQVKIIKEPTKDSEKMTFDDITKILKEIKAHELEIK